MYAGYMPISLVLLASHIAELVADIFVNGTTMTREKHNYIQQREIIFGRPEKSNLEGAGFPLFLE